MNDFDSEKYEEYGLPLFTAEDDEREPLPEEEDDERELPPDEERELLPEEDEDRELLADEERELPPEEDEERELLPEDDERELLPEEEDDDFEEDDDLVEDVFEEEEPSSSRVPQVSLVLSSTRRVVRETDGLRSFSPGRSTEVSSYGVRTSSRMPPLTELSPGPAERIGMAKSVATNAVRMYLIVFSPVKKMLQTEERTRKSSC